MMGWWMGPHLTRTVNLFLYWNPSLMSGPRRRDLGVHHWTSFSFCLSSMVTVNKHPFSARHSIFSPNQPGGDEWTNPSQAVTPTTPVTIWFYSSIQGWSNQTNQTFNGFGSILGLPSLECGSSFKATVTNGDLKGKGRENSKILKKTLN